MRLKCLLGLAVASGALIAASQSASAFDFWNRPERAGWGRLDLIRHWMRGQRGDEVDPYGYFYSPRGYYPYYNSGEWGPRKISRYNGPLPPYYSAWGANRRGYHHVEWHRAHYGGHRRGNW